jgi:hypothetical protein
MALANDFNIADIQHAFQLSYAGCAQSGNVFAVLLPATAYTEPVVEVEQRWILDLKCKRVCKDRNRRAFKVNFGKKEGRFTDKSSVEIFMSNALGKVECPVCHSPYALEFEGTDSVVSQDVGGRPTWAYNFDMDSFSLTARE